MDAPSDMKSRGLRLAEQLMQRQGWTEGKGLGKREDGMSKAIKVKVKCDSAGVGHDSAEQFTFHWWDHVFNKTASSISVEQDQDGVKVKKLSDGDSAVSSKKPRKAMLCDNLLYGRFIKSATLTSGGEMPMEKSSSSSDDSDSSEDEDARLDLSSATKLSDEDLVKICGGRTAHKGARHGLTMSAKLCRIEEQEKAFMEKYGKKETKPQLSKSTSTEEPDSSDGKMSKKKKRTGENINGEVPKKKKKPKKTDCEGSVEDLPNGHDQEHLSSTEEDTVNTKKRSKVPDNIETDEEAEVHKNELSVEEENSRPAKKKKRKTVESQKSLMFNGHTEERNPSDVEESGKSKKKKKKSKKTEDHEELVKDEEHTSYSEEQQSLKSKNKKKRAEKEEKEVENDSSKEGRSRRKKKRTKMEVENEDEPKDEEDAKAAKKKKKSKHKDRRD